MRLYVHRMIKVTFCLMNNGGCQFGHLLNVVNAEYDHQLNVWKSAGIITGERSREMILIGSHELALTLDDPRKTLLGGFDFSSSEFAKATGTNVQTVRFHSPEINYQVCRINN